MNKQLRSANVVFYLLIALVLVAVFSTVLQPKEKPAVPYSEVVSLFEKEQVESFTIKDGVLTMALASRF